MVIPTGAGDCAGSASSVATVVVTGGGSVGGACGCSVGSKGALLSAGGCGATVASPGSPVSAGGCGDTVASPGSPVGASVLGTTRGCSIDSMDAVVVAIAFTSRPSTFNSPVMA